MEREVIIASTEENDAVLENGEVINIPIKTANTIAQTYLENISSDDLYEAEAALKDLNALVQRVIQQTVKAGDADDWHNFAVDIARKDLYDLACDLLECGLSIYPKNIDLLADYLQYGTSCGRIEKCKLFYKVLSKIPKIRWGWRGYSFSVSYLTYLWERSDSEKDLEKLQEEMLSLAAAFRKNLPFDEEIYTTLWVLPRWLLPNRQNRLEPPSLRKQRVISMLILISLCGRNTEQHMLIR